MERGKKELWIEGSESLKVSPFLNPFLTPFQDTNIVHTIDTILIYLLESFLYSSEHYTYVLGDSACTKLIIASRMKIALTVKQRL